tara:strand:+ start:105 stop:989 length:885 start_codon:yes stop_codon:yes gene_type:complete
LKRKSNILIALVALFGLISCENLGLGEKGNPSNEDRIPVARVYDLYLYADDLVGVVPNGTTSLDSGRITEAYVRNWLVKQLMTREANAYLSINMNEVERKVQDYRYALIAYEYEKQMVNEQLDTEVSQEEIRQYYEENKENYELKQNIIRGWYAKIPKGAPRINQVPGWFKSDSEKSKEEFRLYCVQFADIYHLEDSTWLNFDDVIRNTPLAGVPNKVQFLQENEFVETADNEFNYYLKIKEYKFSDQISPLEFVADNIASIIVTKRRVDLVEKMEREIYEKASRQKNFEIFRP